MKYTGNEKLILDGKELRYSMIDFWRYNLSNILLNITRGSFATYLVACAMTQGGYDALAQDKAGNEPWDIDGPQITENGMRRKSKIEVKSTASVQYNTPDEKEPLRLSDTKLTFGIKKAFDWEHKEDGQKRNNDLYVFAHYKAEYKANNMLDMKFWDFYVYPTYKIEEDQRLEKQNTLSIYRLKELGINPVSFENLYAEILSNLADISEHFAGKTV